jgi:hypothetical protein
MANPWFRMYAEFATDPKVQMLSESDQRRLSMLFCLRCNGHVTLQDEEVTFLLRISNDQWASTKALFVERGFINDGNEVLNWDKRQFASDTSKNRVAAYRERKKNEGNDDVTLQKQESNAVDTDTDTDTYIKTTVPFNELLKAYHELMPNNPRCKVLNASRKSAMKARWIEAAQLDCLPFGYKTKADGLAAWVKFFQVCSTSKFLTGQVPGKDGQPSFMADIDFLFSPSGFTKCLENKYHRD